MEVAYNWGYFREAFLNANNTSNIFVMIFPSHPASLLYVPVNSKTAHPPPPGHLTRVKLSTVGNLTQNEARPVGHLTFVSKRLSVVGSKRISQFFDSARERHWRVIALVDSTWVFLLLSFYIVILWNMPLFKVWRKDKLNKKFVVAENFAILVSKGKRFCLYLFISWVHGMTGWGIWPFLKL